MPARGTMTESRLYGLLGSVYPYVCPIQQFIAEIGGAASPALLEPSDAENYKRFVSHLIVCVPGEAKAVCRPLTFQQLSAQSDVVLRVIQRICNKGKRNVLNFGYACVNETSFIRVRSAPNICSYQPNPTTVTIKNSVLWKTLLSRIGDDIMMYLLEHCSLFMLVPPSCCFQLCGVPIYSLITSGTRLPSTWLRQNPVKYRCNISLKCVQKKVRYYKGFLSKSRKWKERLPGDGVANAAQAAGSSRLKRRTILSVPECISAKRARLEVGFGRWTSKDVDTTEIKSLKRCLNVDKVESSAKRVNGSHLSALAQDIACHSTEHDHLLVENKPNASPEITEQSGVAMDQPNKGVFEWKGEDSSNIDVCKPKHPKFDAHLSTVEESTTAEYKRQDPGPKVPEPFEGRGDKSSRSGPFVNRVEIISAGKDLYSTVVDGENSEHTRLQAKNIVTGYESGKGCANSIVAESGERQKCKEVDRARSRKSNQNGTFSDRSTNNTHSTESATGKNADAHRPCHGMVGVLAEPMFAGVPRPTSIDAAAGKNRRKWGTIYVGRGDIMYCNNNRECLPNMFILNRLQDLSTGGQRLVETIFLNNHTFGKKKTQAHPSNYWRKKRFPKRYWQMRNIFFRLLRNHKRCSYLQLLKRNCHVNTQKETKSFRASNVVGKAESRNESNSSSVLKGACRPFSGYDAGLKMNRSVGATFHPIEKQGEFLNKNLKDHNSMRTDLRGHGSTIEMQLEAQTDSLRLSEHPGLCSQPSCLPEHPAMKHKANDKVSVSRDFDHNKESPDSDKPLLHLLKQYSSPLQVHRFLRECLLKVVPVELWGSNHNKCRFLKNVKKFISLGKFDKFSCSELMWKMRVNDCTWLQLTKGQHFVPASEHQLREEILSKFLFWLMDAYVVQLLKSFFYVTETTFMKNTLFYYRKCIWNEVQAIGVRNHLAKVQLQPISHQEVEQKLRQKTIPPPSSLRFIPKTNGLRPIVKMRNIAAPKSSVKGSRFRKIQHSDSQMKVLFGVLNYECQQNPALIGSSVFGLDDIYKAWSEFVLQSLKAGKVRERRPYYFVKADVTGAYDAIPHAKLMEVISGILDPTVQESYCIRRYTKVWMDSSGQIRKSFKSQVSTMMDLLPNMKEFVSHLQQDLSLQHTVLVEQGLTLNESSGQVFIYFKQMIENSTIRIGDKYYVQCCGIPQGSLLSTLLCSLCYGDMENKLFSGIQEDGLMLRLIDDFLLVTPHLANAKRFLRILAAGIPEYGCFISPHKTVINFALDENLPGFSKVKTLPEHSLFPWCGLLFDTQTLEVYCDYSSYADTSIRSSLTFNCSSEAGNNMRRKLLAVLKLKCHQIFLDLEVNTLRTVSINIYKIFLLQAYRFHACVLRLPFGQRVRDNPSFFLEVISDMTVCCYSILKAKNRGISLGSKDASGPFPYEAAQWLCCRAFTVKLSNHKAVYKCLLGPLRTCRTKLQRVLQRSTVLQLQSVTEPALHQDFAVILD
ncbi:telomerase reverse transcriptase isoform X2 [Heterodontus francisci]|uniref:telomerase reverse transcriptase isoform X2 n=1 Tax=Heterodontus francisci TaxID=7792 RepID=UPI00355ADFBD